MNKLLIIVLLFTTAAKAQVTLVADTVYYSDGQKTISYRNVATTTIPTTSRLADTAAAIRATVNTKQNALGFTPYNATNPNGYISAVPAQEWASILNKPTIPSNTNQLVNGSGFLTAPDIAGKQNTLVSGTNIKTVNGTDILGSWNVVISGGATRVFLPNDVANSNAVANTIADITGLSFPVNANVTYYFKFYIIYNSAATTTGSRFCINGPATTFLNYNSQYTINSGTPTFNWAMSGYNLPAGANASSLATNNIAIIEGVVRPSASGTIIARFASEISASAITALGTGRSFVEYQVIN